MANEIATIEEQYVSDLRRLAPQFIAVLPAHITFERFERVVRIALQRDPKLYNVGRKTFFNACMAAATDGLVPDGRDAALVTYKDWKKSKTTGREVVSVQYMPMVAGLLKKIRNSGEVKTICARVVCAGNRYRCWIDDEGEHLEYEQGDNRDPTQILRVFAMAKTKDGELLVEPLTPDEVEKVRAISRAKDGGPWVDWWEEMAKKTAIRRLSKRLPMSTDVDDVLRRENAFYNLQGERERRRVTAPAAREALLQHFTEDDTHSLTYEGGGEDSPATGDGEQAPPQGAEEHHDPETGEIVAKRGPGRPRKAKPENESVSDTSATPSVPASFSEYREHVTSAAFESVNPDALKEWFQGAEQRKIRNGLNMSAEEMAELRDIVLSRINELTAENVTQ